MRPILMKIPSYFLLIIFVSVFSGCAFLKADKADLSTLIELKKTQDFEEQYVKEKVNNFNELSTKLSRGDLKKGDLKDDVIIKAGKPVLRVEKQKGETFVYRPLNENWFSGPKIYLYFDRENRLDHWKCYHVDCDEA